MEQVCLEQRELEVKRLSGETFRLAADLRRSREEVARLKESVEVQIEKVASPLREELATCYGLLMQEKADREADRLQVADLWPEVTALFKPPTSGPRL